MARRRAAHYLPAAIGAAAAAVIALLLLSPFEPLETLGERGLDLVLAMEQLLHPMAAREGADRVVVVDIDDRSLEALGPWPWPRAMVARLIDAIAGAKPAVIAVDILFAAETPGDGTEALARAGMGTPLALGFVLDPEAAGDFRRVPVALRGAPALDGFWRAPGAVGPVPSLAARADGIGALSLPARSDGVVRQVPLLVIAGGSLLPGLAVEAVRLARGSSSYLLEADPPVLATTGLRAPLARNGLLRLLPVPATTRAARAVSAVDVVEGRVAPGRLSGALVLVGGSAPELGGLRATVIDPLTPSVQIEADAVSQILAGRFPRRLTESAAAPVLLAGVLGAIAIVAAAMLAPVAGALALIAAILAAWTASVGLALLADRLTDPLVPTIVAAGGFVAASVASFAATYRREVLVRRRFEQRIAPAVVRRIVEDPDLVKLEGERREITALFTDIEGLTAMTRRADPRELVAVLDTYFERLSAIVVAHGGMIDKIVGDAVHAIFNAPLDLADHPRRALACAIEIRDWTESYRRLPAPAALRLGRTRIGIETGPAVVGDVGIQSRLDYTAYGDAVNAAARLEGANKDLGSAICVGPVAARRCDPAMLRPLGTIFVRGREDAFSVYEPWPADAPPQWRERYLLAFRMIDGDAARAAGLFAELAAERGSDPVPARMAQRLLDRASTVSRS